MIAARLDRSGAWIACAAAQAAQTPIPITVRGR